MTPDHLDPQQGCQGIAVCPAIEATDPIEQALFDRIGEALACLGRYEHGKHTGMEKRGQQAVDELLIATELLLTRRRARRTFAATRRATTA